MGRLSGSDPTQEPRSTGGRLRSGVTSQRVASTASPLQSYATQKKETDFVSEINKIAEGKSSLSYQEQIKRINEASKKGLFKSPEERNQLINATVDRSTNIKAPNAFEMGFKGVVDSIAAPFKRIGEGTAEVLSEVTGQAGRERALVQREQQQYTDEVRRYNAIINDPGRSAVEKERARQAVRNLSRIPGSVSETAGKTADVIIERADPLKAAAAIGQIGLDVVTGGTVRGARAALEAGKAASTAGRIAGAAKNVGGGAAIGASYGALAPIQEKGSQVTGRDIATSAGIGAVIGGVIPGAAISGKALTKAATNVDTKIGKGFAAAGEKLGSTNIGKKVMAAKDVLAQKIVNNLQYVEKPFRGDIDRNTGRQVVEEIRALATNVRQAAGMAVARRKENAAFQELSQQLSGPGGKQRYKDTAEFISKKQNAINNARVSGQSSSVLVGTPEQERAYRLLNQATKDEVQLAYDNGLITKDKYDIYMADDNYTRVQRDLEGELTMGGQGSAEASISSTVFGQKLKGSNKKAVDPYAAYIDWSNRITAQVERNKFANYFTDQLLEKQLGREAVEGATSTLARFRNGIKELVETDPRIVASIKDMDKIVFGALQKYITIPSRLLQAGATGSNIAFAVPNFIRDQVNSFVLSKNPLATHNPLSIIQGIKEGIFKPTVNALARGARITGKNQSLWQPSPLYQKYLADNANMTTVDLVRDLKSATRQAYEELGLKGETPIRKLESIVSATEKAGRYQNFIGTYRKAIRDGDDADLALKKANQAARENSVDFSQRGEYSTFARLFNPYFNASVQGSRSLARALKERPLATATKIGATILVPIAGSTYYNLSDPQRAAVYARIPEYVRASNLIFVLSDGTYIKLPLSPGIKEFGQPIRQFIESEYLGDRPGFLETAKQLLIAPFSPVGTEPNQFMSSAVPQAIRPAVENAANYSFFRDSPIVGENLKDLPTNEQVYEKTPQTYRDIGAILNISPLQAQNLVTGYGAGGAEQLVAALDNARRAAGFDVKGSDRDTINQIKNRFFATKPSETSNAVTNRFYEDYQPLRSQKTSDSKKITALVKEGKIAEAKKKAEAYNKRVDEYEKKFKTTYGRYEKDSALLTELNNLKINLSDRSIKSRQKQGE